MAKWLLDVTATIFPGMAAVVGAVSEERMSGEVNSLRQGCRHVGWWVESCTREILRLATAPLHLMRTWKQPYYQLSSIAVLFAHCLQDDHLSLCCKCISSVDISFPSDLCPSSSLSPSLQLRRWPLRCRYLAAASLIFSVRDRIFLIASVSSGSATGCRDLVF